jgi:hypothetical protein
MRTGERGMTVLPLLRGPSASGTSRSTKRGREDWRTMESRGGITANHYDHVYIPVY